MFHRHVRLPVDEHETHVRLHSPKWDFNLIPTSKWILVASPKAVGHQNQGLSNSIILYIYIYIHYRTRSGHCSKGKMLNWIWGSHLYIYEAGLHMEQQSFKQKARKQLRFLIHYVPTPTHILWSSLNGDHESWWYRVTPPHLVAEHIELFTSHWLDQRPSWKAFTPAPKLRRQGTRSDGCIVADGVGFDPAAFAKGNLKLSPLKTRFLSPKRNHSIGSAAWFWETLFVSNHTLS